VAGCAAGAVLEAHFGLWALVLPVALAGIAVALGEPRRHEHGTQPALNGETLTANTHLVSSRTLKKGRYQ
jgi:hypothetical protein